MQAIASIVNNFNLAKTGMKSLIISKKYFTVICLVCLHSIPAIAQKTGSKVSLVANDGKTYTGTITEVQGGTYKIRYDGFDFEASLTAAQFTVISPPAPPAPKSPARTQVKQATPVNAGANGSKPSQQNLQTWMDRMIAKPAQPGLDGAVTYELLSFQVGSPRKWQYSDGGNPSDGHNTTVYPVKVHFIQKTHYRTRTSVLDRQTVFTSFKDAFGEWKFGYGSTPHVDKSYDAPADGLE